MNAHENVKRINIFSNTIVKSMGNSSRSLNVMPASKLFGTFSSQTITFAPDTRSSWTMPVWQRSKWKSKTQTMVSQTQKNKCVKIWKLFPATIGYYQTSKIYIFSEPLSAPPETLMTADISMSIVFDVWIPIPLNSKMSTEKLFLCCFLWSILQTYDVCTPCITFESLGSVVSFGSWKYSEFSAQ